MAGLSLRVWGLQVVLCSGFTAEGSGPGLGV